MGNLEYEIRWVGYKKLLWKPIDSLKGSVNELLYNYHKEKGLRIYK
jgi:hypothetical protein